MVGSFLARLCGKRVCEDGEGLVLWAKTKNDKFLIKSLYNTLE